jgi:hypothetical protein
MDSKISEIEKIIKENISKETENSIADLSKIIDDRTQAAIDRINGVYTSAINTLKQLELTDATIFDFFQKTKGNIRVVEYNNRFNSTLQLRAGGDSLLSFPEFYLQTQTKYKIIVMAMEIKDEGAPK